jgi:hypothetical protein
MSQRDQRYNCFAWAAHYDDRWLEPDRPYGYWPTDISGRLTLNHLTAVYVKHGFERCESSDPEPGYEKIAISADRRGLPLHAARQLENGKWTSKLGGLEDICPSAVAPHSASFFHGIDLFRGSLAL